MHVEESSITTLGLDGPELARLLASAASCDWRGADDLAAVARRCAWPARLTEWVTTRPVAEVESLAHDAARMWRVFAEPAERSRLLGRWLNGTRVRVDGAWDRPRLVLELDRDDLAVVAAAGLLEVGQRHGAAAIGLCAWAGCDQPRLSTGRRSRSTTCSPRCANRTRVRRHREAVRRPVEARD